MNVTELNKLINQQVKVSIEGLSVSCIIVDAKSTFGHTRVLVRPVKGSGEAWVDISKVEGLK